MRTTSYLEWEELKILLSKIQDKKLRLLFATQSLLGLRIGDALNIKWKQMIVNNQPLSRLVIIESKTKKTRELLINDSLKSIIVDCYEGQKESEYAFLNRRGTKTISRSYVNRSLKKLFRELNIKYEGNISTHLLRKSFARRYLELNNYSEKALLIMKETFGHSSLEITKIYIGLRKDEMMSVYKNLEL